MAETLRTIYGNSLWLQDIDRTVESLPELSELEGKSVLVTGANGLICSAVIDVLMRYNESHGNSIRVIAAGRSEERIKARFKPFLDSESFRFMHYDALSSEPLEFNADFIIHGAGIAHPAAISSDPVGTIMGNVISTNAILNHMAHTGRGQRFVYISSSEVYGRRTEGNLRPFSENDYGYVDILNFRSCYPMGKRSSETLCVNYAEEYGADTVIVRPGHIYGPTASPDDSRVSSAFAYSAAKGEDLIMKSAGLQLRSWCYCPDCAAGILKVLLRGKTANAYNIPGDIMSIREMSELLAKFGGVKLIREGASENELRAFNPMNNSSLDGSKLEALGWKNIFDAQTGFKHTIEILRDMI